MLQQNAPGIQEWDSGFEAEQEDSNNMLVQRDAAAGCSSPCTGVCALGDNGLCVGCSRTLREIGMWSRLPDRERARIMSQLAGRAIHLIRARDENS